MNRLIELGVDPKEKSNDSWTTLHLAARKGHVAVVNRLHDLGIDLNTQSILGSTALHTAAYFGQVNVLGSLLQRSPDLSLIDGFGRTALGWASDYKLQPWAAAGYLPPERRQDGPTARNHLRETVHRPSSARVTYLVDRVI